MQISDELKTYQMDQFLGYVERGLFTVPDVQDDHVVIDLGEGAKVKISKTQIYAFEGDRQMTKEIMRAIFIAGCAVGSKR